MKQLTSGGVEIAYLDEGKGPAVVVGHCSSASHKEWLPLIEGYLRTSPALRGVVQLLDIRHRPSPEDLQMLDFLAEIEAPTVVVLTKIDKLKPREIPERTDAIASSLGSPTNLAVSKYLNAKKVPQILVMAGTTKLDDAQTFPGLRLSILPLS